MRISKVRLGKHLVLYLKDNSLYDMFVENMKWSIARRSIFPRTFIITRLTQAFVFSNTDQGYEFWTGHAIAYAEQNKSFIYEDEMVAVVEVEMELPSDEETTLGHLVQQSHDI